MSRGIQAKGSSSADSLLLRLLTRRPNLKAQLPSPGEEFSRLRTRLGPLTRHIGAKGCSRSQREFPLFHPPSGSTTQNSENNSHEDLSLREELSHCSALYSGHSYFVTTAKHVTSSQGDGGMKISLQREMETLRRHSQLSWSSREDQRRGRYGKTRSNERIFGKKKK